MSQPMALASFYDDLMRHDWYYDRSDDHAVWRRGEDAAQRLQGLAKTSPEHQALYRQVQAYQTGPRDVEKPPRPAEGAPFTLPPARPSEDLLAPLSEEDRESVLTATNPAARLAQVNRRLALDAKLSIVDVLKAFGATPSENPARWTFPDGTRAMIKVDRQAWVEQNAMLSTGNGATRLAMRLLGQPEDVALQTLESQWGLAHAVPRGQPPAPMAPPPAMAASPSVGTEEPPKTEPPRRFQRRR